MEREKQIATERRTRKVPPKGTAERREYDKLSKRNQRERERQQTLAKSIPNAWDYKMPATHQKALAERIREVLKAIRTQSPENLATEDEYVVEGMVGVLFGLENNIAQRVERPAGMLVGGRFPDVVWSNAIERAHQFPKLLDSNTFAELYARFLQAVTKWNNQAHGAHSAPEFIVELKAEIAGSYILNSRDTPVIPAPAPVEVLADTPG